MLRQLSRPLQKQTHEHYMWKLHVKSCEINIFVKHVLRVSCLNLKQKDIKYTHAHILHLLVSCAQIMSDQ